MAWREVPHELRRGFRVRSKGSVHIGCGTRLIEARVIDVALGGISMRTEGWFELVRLIGKFVRVEIRPDAGPLVHFVVFGRVLRASVLRNIIVIGFDTVSPEFAAWVASELIAAVKHDALPRLILVDSLVARRTAIASAFRIAGCHVHETSTPLEAIAHLSSARFAPSVIAVADTMPVSVGKELRAFLLEQDPHVHMLAIGRSAGDRDPMQTWLSSIDAHHDLQARVDRVMTSHGARRRSTKSRQLTRL